MEKRVAIVNRTAPLGSSVARESLDLVLALSAYNESISLFFIDDGVYQLLDNQHADIILQKNFQPMLAMLELYDVEQIYVCESSLQQRNLKLEQLAIDVEVLNKTQINNLLAEQEQIMSF